MIYTTFCFVLFGALKRKGNNGPHQYASEIRPEDLQCLLNSLHFTSCHPPFWRRRPSMHWKCSLLFECVLQYYQLTTYNLCWRQRFTQLECVRTNFYFLFPSALWPCAIHTQVQPKPSKKCSFENLSAKWSEVNVKKLMAKFLKKQFSTEHSSLNQWRNPECVGEWNHSNNCLSKGWAIPLSPCIHNIFLLPYNTEWKKAKLLEWPDTTSYSFCYSYFLSVSLLTIHTLKAQPLYIQDRLVTGKEHH